MSRRRICRNPACSERVKRRSLRLLGDGRPKRFCGWVCLDRWIRLRLMAGVERSEPGWIESRGMEP